VPVPAQDEEHDDGEEGDGENDADDDGGLGPIRLIR
jgi:hypothetical protein